MKKNNPKLSIIIPTLNEEEGIAKVICSIPEEIIKKPKIYEKLDFFGRKLSGKFYAYMFGLKVFDPLAGFRAIRRKDWDALNLKSDGVEIETEMNIKAMKNHFKIEQVLLPNLRRSGGVTASKFLLSPKSIIKVIRIVLEYKLEKVK